MAAICKGRSVSDKKGKYYLPFYNQDGEILKKFYHVPVFCEQKPLKNNDLCGICAQKEINLSKFLIENGVLKNPTGGSVSHPSVLHGKVDEPIPEWSHIKDGLWFKKMIQKGYRIEMGKKLVVDEKKINEAISKLKGKKSDKIEALRKQFPELSVTAASKFITNFGKSATATAATTTNELVENVIVSLQEKCYISNESKKEVDDVKEIFVKPITVSGTNYYYDPETSKVYTTEYNYVGRYCSKEQKIDTSYEDSDAEPSL